MAQTTPTAHTTLTTTAAAPHHHSHATATPSQQPARFTVLLSARSPVLKPRTLRTRGALRIVQAACAPLARSLPLRAWGDVALYHEPRHKAARLLEALGRHKEAVEGWREAVALEPAKGHVRRCAWTVPVGGTRGRYPWTVPVDVPLAVARPFSPPYASRANTCLLDSIDPPP